MVTLRSLVFLAASALLTGVAAQDTLADTAVTVDLATLGSNCKCSPDDWWCWPSDRKWDKLNKTVDGRLFSTIPPGAACFPDFYGTPTADANQCTFVQEQWTNSSWMIEQQVAPFFPFYSNNTCHPGATGEGCAATCLRGYLPEYVIMAESASDIQAGIKFAKKFNLRLVIRNTGHCFMGRSVGGGSLAINVHNVRGIDLIDSYDGPGGYTGGAVKAAAGVTNIDLYDILWNLDTPREIVGGECPTVGYAGGYIQGGGQGPLSGYHGLASDNALEYEVVLASGKLVTVNEDNYSDLFWALKGGGPGTFGVVTSVTVKTHEIVPVSGTQLIITGESDTFWEGWRIWYSKAKSYTEHGMYVWYAGQEGSLIAGPFVAPNKTAEEVEVILAPLVEELTAAGVTFQMLPITTYAKFGDLYEDIWYTGFHGSGMNALVGGRLISETDMENNADDIVATYREMSNTLPGRVAFGGHLVNPGVAVTDPDQSISAVHRVWRETADIEIFLLVTDECNTAEERDEAQDQVTNLLGQMLRDVTPTSAVYSNEGDPNEPDWQSAFWGQEIYPQLLSIKNKYDPYGIFWSQASPGAEQWKIVGESRLCRA